MKELANVREEIDGLDREIVSLLGRRLRLADAVADAKAMSGRPVTDPVREREILARVTEQAGPDLACGVRRVYSTLFGVSKARQRLRLKRDCPLLQELPNAERRAGSAFPETALVACSGGEGSYAQQAAAQIFAVPKILYFNGFESVFEAVEKGLCAYGVLPVENSSAGSVTAVYDLMQRHRFHIVRGVRLKVHHVLLANRGTKLADVREVASHPQALSQCAAFLKAHRDLRVVPSVNTAVAAQELSASGRTDVAVIASRACAELYGLEVLSEEIMDSSFNYTRFICIARELAVYPKANRFSLMLSLPHRAGSLSDVLDRFASSGINLTKLESRPVLGSDFEFRFIFEFEASPDDAAVQALLAELSTDPEIEHFTFLGAYKE